MPGGENLPGFYPSVNLYSRGDSSRTSRRICRNPSYLCVCVRRGFRPM